MSSPVAGRQAWVTPIRRARAPRSTSPDSAPPPISLPHQTSGASETGSPAPAPTTPAAPDDVADPLEQRVGLQRVRVRDQHDEVFLARAAREPHADLLGRELLVAREVGDPQRLGVEAAHREHAHPGAALLLATRADHAVRESAHHARGAELGTCRGQERARSVAVRRPRE